MAADGVVFCHPSPLETLLQHQTKDAGEAADKLHPDHAWCIHKAVGWSADANCNTLVHALVGKAMYLCTDTNTNLPMKWQATLHAEGKLCHHKYGPVVRVR